MRVIQIEPEPKARSAVPGVSPGLGYQEKARVLRKKVKCKGEQINLNSLTEITQQFELILFYHRAYLLCDCGFMK